MPANANKRLDFFEVAVALQLGNKEIEYTYDYVANYLHNIYYMLQCSQSAMASYMHTVQLQLYATIIIIAKPKTPGAKKEVQTKLSAKRSGQELKKALLKKM